MYDWNSLKQKLHQVYVDQELEEKFEYEEQYLKEAFDFTEKLWIAQFEKISVVNIVLLTEAPLFGEKQVYFYNSKSKNTAFFHFNDLSALDVDVSGSFESHAMQKDFLIDQVTKKGFLILDLFPFALNQNDTSIYFQKMGSALYKQLLDISLDYYLLPKLELLKTKSHSNTIFVYRYKRLKEITGVTIEDQLIKKDLLSKGVAVESINGSNMSLDRELLKSLYQKSVHLH